MFNVKKFIGKSYDIQSEMEQRGVADLIEGKIARHIITNHNGTKATSLRSIEDVKVGEHIWIDTKTLDINKQFHMPNMISIERLKKLYDDKQNELIYIFVKYSKGNGKVNIVDVEVLKIEDISWDSLQVSNLGNGQVQIKNANNKTKKFIGTRAEWLNILKQKVISFIDKQIEKRIKQKIVWEQFNEE